MMICSSPVKGIDVYIAIREEMVIDRDIIIYKHADCSPVHQHYYIKLRQTFHWWAFRSRRPTAREIISILFRNQIITCLESNLLQFTIIYNISLNKW